MENLEKRFATLTRLMTVIPDEDIRRGRAEDIYLGVVPARYTVGYTTEVEEYHGELLYFVQVYFQYNCKTRTAAPGNAKFQIAPFLTGVPRSTLEAERDSAVATCVEMARRDLLRRMKEHREREASRGVYTTVPFQEYRKKMERDLGPPTPIPTTGPQQGHRRPKQRPEQQRSGHPQQQGRSQRPSHQHHQPEQQHSGHHKKRRRKKRRRAAPEFDYSN